MRIAAVSDIHGNLPALRAVLDDIGRQHCDITVNLGDIVSGPLLPAATADLLVPLGLPTIRGNHERQLLENPRARTGASDAFARDRLSPSQLDWLARLPATDVLANGDVLLCHGTPDSDLDFLLHALDGGDPREATPDEVAAHLAGTRASLVLCGHSHLPRALRLADGRLVVNPGSVGLPAYAHDQPYRYRVQTGTPQARYAIVDGASGRWQAELRTVDYDHGSMAGLADRNGRPDWAHALRTGRVPGATDTAPG